MKAKILIIGGSGLLALNWALAVRDVYDVMLGLNRRNVKLTDVVSLNVNLESLNDIIHLLTNSRPALVINSAGLTSVEKCEIEPELAHQVNVIIASNIAKACSILGIKFVQISTDHLFSGRESFVSEDQFPDPVNVYGKTKAEAEFQVLDNNPNALVIRTNFYAWGTSYRSSFSDVIIKSLRNESPLTLFDDVFYTPILAEFVILTIHDLIKCNATGIFNIAGDQRISKYEFGLKIAEKFNLDYRLIMSGHIIDQPNLVTRPHDMSLSNIKLINFLGRHVGEIDQHITRLRQQELNGNLEEIRAL